MAFEDLNMASEHRCCPAEFSFQSAFCWQVLTDMHKVFPFKVRARGGEVFDYKGQRFFTVVGSVGMGNDQSNTSLCVDREIGGTTCWLS